MLCSTFRDSQVTPRRQTFPYIRGTSTLHKGRSHTESLGVDRRVTYLWRQLTSSNCPCRQPTFHLVAGCDVPDSAEYDKGTTRSSREKPSTPPWFSTRRVVSGHGTTLSVVPTWLWRLSPLLLLSPGYQPQRNHPVPSGIGGEDLGLTRHKDSI
jgi:hypothetical protein